MKKLLLSLVAIASGTGAIISTSSCGSEKKSDTQVNVGHQTHGNQEHSGTTIQNLNLSSLHHLVIQVKSPTLISKDLGEFIGYVLPSVLDDVFGAKLKALQNLHKKGVNASGLTIQTLGHEVSKVAFNSLMNETIELRFEEDHFKVSIKDLLGMLVSSNGSKPSIAQETLHQLSEGKFSTLSFATNIAPKILAGHEEYISPVLGLLTEDFSPVTTALSEIMPDVGSDVKGNDVSITGLMGTKLNDAYFDSKTIAPLLTKSLDSEEISNNEKNRTEVAKYLSQVLSSKILEQGNKNGVSDAAINAMLKASSESVSKEEYLAIAHVSGLEEKAWSSKTTVSSLLDVIVSSTIATVSSGHLEELDWGLNASSASDIEIFTNLNDLLKTNKDIIVNWASGLFLKEEQENAKEFISKIVDYLLITTLPREHNTSTQEQELATSGAQVISSLIKLL